MNTALTISIMISIICLFVAFLYFVGYMAERNLNKRLWEDREGEERRNQISYESGVRTGRLYEQLGVSVLDDHRKADRCSEAPSLDAWFTGTTPADFPRPMGVLPVPHDAA